MRNNSLNSSKPKYIRIAIWCSILYIFIAFIPHVAQPINTGLDPSWSYAIGEATQKQLIFGKDIIFTYGPLGYLISGSSLEHNFWQITLFRWLIYLLLFAVSIIRILTIKSHIHQLLLGLSILYALLMGISVDYQILSIYLIILTFDSIFQRYPRLTPLLLGVVSGFCLMTKFSLGIYVFGSLTLFLLMNFYKAIIAKTRLEIATNTCAIINSLLAATSISWILLIPSNSLLSLSTILVNIFISAASGFSVWLIKRQINYKSDTSNTNETNVLNISSNKYLLPWLIFYLSYFSLLAYTICYSPSPSLVNYLQNSLEISSGYSSAMSLVVAGTRRVQPALLPILLIFSKIQLAFALSICFLIIWTLFFLAKDGYFNFSLALFFILLIALKHGFVRQDNHVVLFTTIAPLFFVLCLLKIKRFRYLTISYHFYKYILIVGIVISLPSIVMFGVFTDMAAKLIPNEIISNVSSLLNFKSLQIKIEQESKLNLANSKLPENVIKIVGSKLIDIIPWEISLVPANNLNWKPRPIFQSYSAYTTALDNINFKSLSTEPRDYILYSFSSIDERHPFFDEPKTFFYVFCNYQPSNEVSDLINLPHLSINSTHPSTNLILLKKQQSSRCLPSNIDKSISIPWNTPQLMEMSGSIIRAKVKFTYSLFGKIYKAVFRSPPVMMQVNYVNGFSQSYRIIPENSDNGILLSHLPRNDNEAMSLFRGQLTAPIKSFSFHTSNLFLYKPTIKVSLLTTVLN